MIYGAWVLLLLLLTLLFSQWLDRQNNPNRQLIDMATQNGVAELVLKRNRAGHYLVPGTINGVEVDFLLDTGATYVAVPQSIAEKAGLNRLARTQSMTANGLTPSWLSEIAEVRIGPITMRDVRAAILPSMPGNEVLLGMSFLKHLKLEQQGDSLKLTLP
ncbi:MAG: TIGR02281 family clan AA aspartic protease [Candidatus Thiodiazotropha sp. (ex Monitilora ramsayi)]|nr:TIGR02281 family clan AA aspartic protease [Candidatus Thiodiazotropha sp. (ex Monitilora ramsayi)]